MWFEGADRKFNTVSRCCMKAPTESLVVRRHCYGGLETRQGLTAENKMAPLFNWGKAL